MHLSRVDRLKILSRGLLLQGVVIGGMQWVHIFSNYCLESPLNWAGFCYSFCDVLVIIINPAAITPVLINAVPNPIIWMENIIKNIHKKVKFEKVPSNAYIECYGVYPPPYIGVKFSRLSIVSMV